MTGATPRSGLAVFSHGRDSSPQATKITALSPLAAERGFRTLSIDYRSSNDPAHRVEILIEALAEETGPILLIGSSLGGLVSVFASQRLEVEGMFLMAPAVYWPGYEHLDYRCGTRQMAIVHGWSDDVVPVETSIRLAREHEATLHVLDDDHRLIRRLPEIEVLFAAFLDRVLAGRPT